MLTCGSDHFTIHVNIPLLCCAPETYVMLYVSYTSIKNKISGEKA